MKTLISFAVAATFISPALVLAGTIPTCTLAPYSTNIPANSRVNIEYHIQGAPNAGIFMFYPNGALLSMGVTSFANGTISLTPTTTTQFMFRLSSLFGFGYCYATINTF